MKISLPRMSGLAVSITPVHRKAMAAE